MSSREARLTVRMRLARRAATRIIQRRTREYAPGTYSGCRNASRSCTVSTTGTPDRHGPKFAGQCTRSASCLRAAPPSENSSPRAHATRSSPLMPESTTRPGNHDVSVAASSRDASPTYSRSGSSGERREYTSRAYDSMPPFVPV